MDAFKSLIQIPCLLKQLLFLSKHNVLACSNTPFTTIVLYLIFSIFQEIFSFCVYLQLCSILILRTLPSSSSQYALTTSDLCKNINHTLHIINYHTIPHCPNFSFSTSISFILTTQMVLFEDALSHTNNSCKFLPYNATEFEVHILTTNSNKKLGIHFLDMSRELFLNQNNPIRSIYPSLPPVLYFVCVFHFFP